MAHEVQDQSPPLAARRNLAALTSCTAPQIDLDAGRLQNSSPRPSAQRGRPDEDLARVAFLASHAESDGLALFAWREKKVRDAVAASPLAYAQHAQELGESSTQARAQFAWALG